MGGCASKPREHNANPPSENPSPAELPGKSDEAAGTTAAPEEMKAEAAAADVAVDQNGRKKESLSDILAATPAEPSEEYVSFGDEPKPDIPQPTAGPAEIVEEREGGHAKETAEEVPVGAQGTENPRAAAAEPEAPEQKPVEAPENVEEGVAAEGDVAEAPTEARDAAAPPQQGTSTAGAPKTAPVQKDETLENSPAMVESSAPASSASLA